MPIELEEYPYDIFVRNFDNNDAEDNTTRQAGAYYYTEACKCAMCESMSKETPNIAITDTTSRFWTPTNKEGIKIPLTTSVPAMFEASTIKKILPNESDRSILAKRIKTDTKESTADKKAFAAGAATAQRTKIRAQKRKNRSETGSEGTDYTKRSKCATL